MRLSIVVDTNVVVSGILTSYPIAPTARIVDAMLQGSLIFLLSVNLLAEYWAVLLRPALRSRHGLDDSEIDIVLTTLADNAVVREPVDPPSLPRARSSHQLPAAAGDTPHPAGFSHFGVLDVLSSTPPRPSDRKSHWARHLADLATKAREKTGLDRVDRHLWALLAAHPGTVLVTGDRALLENPPTWAKVVAPVDLCQNL